MKTSAGSFVVFLMAGTLLVHVQAFWKDCIDFDNVSATESRDVFVNVLSADCGLPLTDVLLKPFCHSWATPTVIPTTMVAPGLYKYRAPNWSAHTLTVEKQGFHHQFVNVDSGDWTSTQTTNILCGAPSDNYEFMNMKEHLCTSRTVQVTVNHICEETDNSVPVIWPTGPVTTEYVSPGVNKFTVCPSCTGTINIMTEHGTKVIPVPSEDLVFDIDCKVDGKFSVFSEYTECSVSCGGGTQTRTRACDDPAPLHGGADCVGEATETLECNTDPCTVDGVFSKFSLFTNCSAPCGGGTQNRTRACDSPAPLNGGADCVGETVEVQECNTDGCTVDGGWSDFVYTECIIIYNGCRRNGTRTCTDPVPAFDGAGCEGNATVVNDLCYVTRCYAL